MNGVRNGEETHRVRSEKDQRSGAARNVPGLAGKVTNRMRPHKNSAEEPGDKYARRPRHKTREDRYDYKDVPKKVSKRRPSKSSIKKKPGAMLNDEFQAPNVATERLTLRSTGPGFLSKIKAPGSTEWKDLPDLTFSEMRFLERKREDDNARLQQIRDAQPKQKSGKPPNQEIADFFSRSEISRDETTSVRQPPSMVSYPSLSVSPPQQPATLIATASRSGFVAHAGEQRERDVRNDLSRHTSIDPNSSVSNQFFRDLTMSALLRGVDTFPPRERRYYSLEDLRVLAKDTTTRSSRHEEIQDESYALWSANGPTTALQLCSDDTMRRPERMRRKPAVEVGGSSSRHTYGPRQPLTRTQNSTYTAEYEPQQAPYEPAAVKTAPKLSVDNTLSPHQRQLLQIPAHTRGIVIPRANEQENELDLLPSYVDIPLSQPVRLRDGAQFIEENDEAETSSAPRVLEGAGLFEARELVASTSGHGVKKVVEHTQFGLPPAAELQISDRWAHGTDVMDAFDENLLRDFAEGFSSWEGICHGDDQVHGGSQDRASRDTNKPAAYTAVGKQCRQGTMGENCGPNGARFPETGHHVVHNPNTFNGFSQGQILY